MKGALVVISLLLVVSCSSSDKKFSQIHPGMTKEQVIAKLGTPNGFKLENGAEILRYSNDDRYVKLRNGRVTECGEE